MLHFAGAGGLLSATIILCGAVLSGCNRQEPQQPATENRASDEPPASQLPIIEPPFNRSRLLLTVARAASAHSTRIADADILRSLDGKRFELRLRFGCDGQGPGKGEHGWSVDPDGRTLRLRAVANLSLSDASVKAVAGEGVEGVEGFWLARPWQLQAACPAPQSPDAEPADETDNEPPSNEAGSTSVAQVG